MSLDFVRRHRASAAIAAVLATQLACTSYAVVPLVDPTAQLQADGPTFTLTDDEGGDVPITAESDLTFVTRDGQRLPPVEAGLLCRMQEGLAMRTERKQSCMTATPLVAWENIEHVEVENFDGAGTVAITAGAVVILTVAVVAIAGGGKLPSTSGGQSKSKGSSGTPATPRVGGQGPVAHGPGPGPSPRPLPSHGGDFHSHGHVHVGGPIVIVPIGGGGGGSGRTVSTVSDDDGTLFTRSETRRASVRGLVEADGGACILLASCVTAGLRGGVRVSNLLELSLGARAVQGYVAGGGTAIVPVFGLTLHGEFPRARWAAITLGGRIGTGAATTALVEGTVGLRLSPARGLWLGLNPLHPTYTSWSDGRGWALGVATSLDVAYDF